MDYRIPSLSYAPDGLYESDIDALIAECFMTGESYGLPSTVSDRVATTRHVRHLDCQTVSTDLCRRSVEQNHTDGAAA